MNSQEWRATGVLSIIQALRMLGMFMILPVFELYARGLPGGATAFQAGLAFGIYGLVQAVLQIPFGILSDRIGRKPVIVGGLALFAFGSFVAGATHDIHWIMIGRALQGTGAISGAVSALLADVTRQQVRTTAMALMGAGTGLSFLIALVLGPILSGGIGVDGIFQLTGVLALLCIPLVLFALPGVQRHAYIESAWGRILADGQMLRLNAGIFMLHTMMTALFLCAPQAIVATLGLPAPQHWKVYLPVLLVSIVPVLGLIRRIEQNDWVKPAFLGSIVLCGGSLLMAGLGYTDKTWLYAALLVFFLGFNYLEGTLPSLISRRAPPHLKGVALGIYSSSQFLGGWFGSGASGWLLSHLGLAQAFLGTAALSLIWLVISAGLKPVTSPGHLPVESPVR